MQNILNRMVSLVPALAMLTCLACDEEETGAFDELEEVEAEVAEVDAIDVPDEVEICVPAHYRYQPGRCSGRWLLRLDSPTWTRLCRKSVATAGQHRLGKRTVCGLTRFVCVHPSADCQRTVAKRRCRSRLVSGSPTHPPSLNHWKIGLAVFGFQHWIHTGVLRNPVLGRNISAVLISAVGMPTQGHSPP